MCRFVHVVILADELVLVDHIEFLASRELLPTDHAGETVEMKHFVSGASHQIAWHYTCRTTSTLCSVSPEEIGFTEKLPFSRKTSFGQSGVALAALHALDVPGSVQNIQQKSVHNWPFTASTQLHHGPAEIGLTPERNHGFEYFRCRCTELRAK